MVNSFQVVVHGDCWMWPAADLRNTVPLNWYFWSKIDEDCLVACLKFLRLAVARNTERVKTIDGDNLKLSAYLFFNQLGIFKSINTTKGICLLKYFIVR